jgi:hypothetical protein
MEKASPLPHFHRTAAEVMSKKNKGLHKEGKVMN